MQSFCRKLEADDIDKIDKWAFAAVAGVVLTVVMATFVAIMLRIVNLRNQL